MADIEEVWEVVDGYDGVYSISNLGRVSSKARIQVYADGRIYNHPYRILKPSTAKTGKSAGYMITHFYCGGKRTTLSVHRLVAEAFIPNPENKICVNHIDGNKSNNNVSNLEWSTYAENNAHALETGLKEQTPASYKSKLSKLSREARLDILENYKRRVEGFTFADFAKKYNVSDETCRVAYEKGLRD